MASHDLDVVIVGAGVSGLLTARALIGRGCKVVVIDQRLHPARNASFHGVVESSELSSAGIDPSSLQRDGYRISGIDDLERGDNATVELWSVPHRLLLENLSEVIDTVSGTDVQLALDDGRVSGAVCEGRRFASLVTVLADQSDPRLAEGPSLRPDWPPTHIMHVGKRRYPNTMRGNRVLTWSGTSSWGQPGWAMVVPYRDEVTVIAAMVLEDAMASARHVTELLDEVVVRDEISLIFGGAAPLDEFTEVVPIGGFQAPTNVAADGVILVGDMLGLTNPMTRDGISSSLHPASLAAAVIEKSIALNDASEMVLGEFGDRIQREMTVRGLIGNRGRAILLQQWMELDRTRDLNWEMVTKSSHSANLNRKRGAFWSISRNARS